MKIYTKKGDSGTTGLIGGTRVPKNHIRIESYGTIDELNSYIGLIRDQEISNDIKEVLIEVQDRLFTLGSLLAADPDKSKMILPQVHESDVTFIENKIDEMDETLEPIKSFVLPGGHPTVSYTHIARCICRRAERLVVQLSEEYTVDPIIIQYLNRLSDYLFTLSRKLTKNLGATEQAWVSRK
jgi:cob(I)alamin adenosyltransferase